MNKFVYSAYSLNSIADVSYSPNPKGKDEGFFIRSISVMNNQMKNYYFTFGSFHRTVDMKPLKDVWVRVVAKGYGMARLLFMEEFAKKHLPSPEHWSVQYEEQDIDKSFFPGGELTVIRQINTEKS